MLMHVFDSPRNTELYAAEPSDVGCSREREVMLLEVIACSVRDAIEAQRGGAGRLELVRALGRGGLTPSLDLVEDVLRTVTIPVRVMIRESDGYLAGTAAEIDRLAHLAERSASLGANGVVVGFLRRGKLDDDALDEVLAASNGVGATFHRAFDGLPDPIEALRELQRWPTIDRVLSSGGPGTWPDRAARLCEWSRAVPAIGLLPGGGLDRDAVRILADAGLTEAHTGRAVREPPTVEGAVSAQKVAELLAAARQ
jgi:copper homeostasis protein